MTQNLNVIYGALWGAEEESVSSEAIDYQMVTYLKYDYACRADHAKKILEKSLVESFLEQHVDLAHADKLCSLDIGCATGRYPTWFAGLGFEAHGYDIAEEAIRICRERGAKFSNVHFAKCNVLEDEVEAEKFHIITCMMGTFNHIELAQRGLFFKKIRKMLKPGGVAILSSWNSACPYTNHLQFYTREEREFLKENSTTSEAFAEQLLQTAGLRVRAITHFGYHPDECYESWAAEQDEAAIIELDGEMRQRLGGRNSQMYLAFVEREEEF